MLADKRVDPSVIDDLAIRVAAQNSHIECLRLPIGDSRVDPSANENIAIRIAAKNGHKEYVHDELIF